MTNNRTMQILWGIAQTTTVLYRLKLCLVPLGGSVYNVVLYNNYIVVNLLTYLADLSQSPER